VSARDWTKPTSEGLVDRRKDRGVAVLTLQDGKANAYSYPMMLQLDEAILDARFDPAVHVIVIIGAGDKFFCAGANIEMLQTVDPYFKYHFCLHANETLNRLEQTPKLTIAAINGHCMGGGLEIAMACDLRVAKKDGGKIGLPEVTLGVLPGTGGTQRLARLVGKSRAIEWMCEARSFTVDEAATAGLVNRVFEAAGFLDRVVDWAREFCPPNCASRAVGNIKRAVQSGLEMSFEQGLALERELQQQLFTSDDAREGISAFNGGRKPNFSGR
jgi:enoyl-CoA hydratase